MNSAGAAIERSERALEWLRLGSLAVAVGTVFHFLFNQRMVGGTDGRWYAYTMVDALAQARAGHWPILVGQGELQWNGAIHPFRTAPYFNNLGALLDFLTARRLTPLGIVHLTLLVSLLQCVLLGYWLLGRLEPRARGLAWLAMLLWILSPLAIDYVVNLEMYMTLMTFGWLPLVFYGHVRILRRDDGIGWACLAAGLALTWMCHAPVAAWASMTSAAIQGFRLLSRDFRWPCWRRALGWGLAFAVLGAYYFVSVAEVGGARGTPQSTIGSLELLLAGAAGVRLLSGGSPRWWAPGAGAVACLWSSNRLYFSLAVGFLVWTALVKIWRHRRSDRAAGTRAPELAAVGWLVSAAFAGRFLALSGPGPGAAHALADLYPGVFLPIVAPAVALADLQPGWTLAAFCAAGVFMAFWRGDDETRLLAATLLAFAPLVIPIPGASMALLTGVPDWVYGMKGLGWIRVVPACSFLAVFVSVAALAPAWRSLAASRRAARWGLAALGAAGLGWECAELAKMEERGRGNVNTPEQTALFYRTEQAQLYYAYDGLPMPRYMLNGVLDYHLESRLLRAGDLEAIPDPALSSGVASRVTLASTPIPMSPWLRLSPVLAVGPGERELLTFEFFPRKDYHGTLVIQSDEGLFNAYYLPDGGYFERSFGVAEGRPKSLAVWNSLERAEGLKLIFLRPEATSEFGDFARLRIQPYRPADLRVDTLGLIPYHARVRVPEPAYLETPRTWIPGYRAMVDGRPAAIEVSPDHLAMIRLDPGTHDVVVSYHLTSRVKAAGMASALGWLGLLAAGFRRFRRRA